MLKAILIIVLVFAVLVGGLLTLRSGRNAGMPGADVIERARQRERDIEAAEKKDESEKR